MNCPSCKKNVTSIEGYGVKNQKCKDCWHQQKLDFIRSKCVAANPDIVALRFGCQLFFKQWYGDIEKGEMWNVAKLVPNAVLIAHPDGARVSRLHLPLDESIQVTGRPIRLADIVLTIEERAEVVGWYRLLEVLKKKTFLIGNEGTLYTFIIYEYDLKNDDLTKQSEDTVSFLYDLLS